MDQIVSREYTINLHKRVFGATFKKRAPKAIKQIKLFAQKTMRTDNVVIDPSLNQQVWLTGIKSVPHRMRLRLSRKRSDADDKKLFTLVEYVPCVSFKGLQTTRCE